MGWLTAVWTWITDFLGAAGKVKYLEARLTGESAEWRERLGHCEGQHDECRKELAGMRAALDEVDTKVMCPTIVCDEKGKIVDISIGACRMLHWSREAVGQNILTLIPYPERAAHTKAFVLAAAAKRTGPLSTVKAHVLTRSNEPRAVVIKTSAWISDEQWLCAAEFKIRVESDTWQPAVDVAAK